MWLCPFGKGNPSTDSEKRTTKFSGEMSASFTDTIAFRTASATFLRVDAVRHAFGSQVICTKGIFSVLLRVVCSTCATVKWGAAVVDVDGVLNKIQ